MRKGILATAAVLAIAIPASAQDWKGMGRLSGKVTNEQGQPIPDATVKLELPGSGGTSIKTDKKGRWALGGIAAGTWNIDFEVTGYALRAIKINLPAENARLAPIEIVLEKARPTGPAPEVVAALDTAEAAYEAGRFAEARAEYEKALAELPQHAATIHQRIGLTYLQEKQYEKALEHLDKVLAAQPDNHQIRAIAAQAALEGGLLDRGRALLLGLDESTIKSPDVFFNMGVNFLNAGQVPDAIDYFGKAIRVDPSYVDAYYRRALGYLGQGKSAEARADFQKVLELQPEGQMADMSRRALEQLP